MTTRQLRATVISASLVFLPMQADAQFFKKLFKKKPKTEVVAKVSSDVKNVPQTVMLNPDSLKDNSNNRNGFAGIPLGINAEKFERMLVEKGFVGQAQQANQTAKTYRFTGDVMGSPATVTLIVSEKTATVYAVDVEEPTVYSKEADVKKRFAQLKASLVETYGKGYVDNGGEGYNIMTRLGCVNLHFERITVGGGYMIGFSVDDAKAYATAYEEMADKEYEAKPRTVAQGLAEIEKHTDVVGLGTRLIGSRYFTRARNVLKEYEYATNKITTRELQASFALPGGYSSKAVIRRKGSSLISFIITANEDKALLEQAVKVGGYVSAGKNTYKNGKVKMVWTEDKQGNQILKFTAATR